MNTKHLPDTNLLPLRIAGQDHPYGPGMLKILSATLLAGDALWSHFPWLCARPDATGACAEDLILHPASLELDNPVVTDGRTVQRSRGHSPGFSLDADEAGERLRHYFELASQIHEQADHLTPYQLLRAAFHETTEASGTCLLFRSTQEQHLAADLGSLPERPRTELTNLLCLMRELHYRGMLVDAQRPQTPIALHGRAAHQAPVPVPYTEHDPAVDLGSHMDPELRHVRLDQPMHTMVLGASGTGKTWSVMIPQLRGHLAYRLADGTQGAALVVDPKKELTQVTEDCLARMKQPERLFVAGRHGRLRLFSRRSPLSLKDRITLLMDALDVNPENRSDSGPWIQTSLALLTGLSHSHAVAYNHNGRNLFADLMQAAGRPSSHEQGYWFALRDVIRLLQEGLASARWLHQRLMALATAMKLPAEERAAFQFLARYVSMDEEGANQLSYVTGGLEGALTSLCDASLSAWLDLSPLPELNDDPALHDVATLIETSRVIVFQPDDSPSGDTGTRLLKAQFYRCAMERRNMHQPILFLCDEFQRFITCDRESGEASLLDRCRAYRITAVLATQSITALYDALAKRRDGGNPKYAVNCILSNIAHVFYFQTLDPDSMQALKTSLPAVVPSGWPHPLDVVPLSSMRVGEAYYVTPQGRWGRTQFKLAA